MLVVRSVTGYIVAYEIKSATETATLNRRSLKIECVDFTAFPQVFLLSLLVTLIHSALVQRLYRKKSSHVCLSRQYSLLLNAKAPKSCMASLYLACVASVSNRVIARKLERKRH